MDLPVLHFRVWVSALTGHLLHVLRSRVKCRNSTCENDVGDVAMATVSKLLRVLRVAVASQTHHKSLGVIEGGVLVVQAVRADGGLHHVELLQLAIPKERNNATSP